MAWMISARMVPKRNGILKLTLAAAQDWHVAGIMNYFLRLCKSDVYR